MTGHEPRPAGSNVPLIEVTTASSPAPSSAPAGAPPRRRAVLSLSFIAALVLSLAVSAPAAAARPFRLDFYRPGDFVGQTNNVQCVGASMQMMVNMIRSKNDRTAATQLRLQNLARQYSPPRSSAGGTSQPVRRRGASSKGWAFGLSMLGYGPYRVTSTANLSQAVNLAADHMRRTGRPAGLLVWQGAHAWVMSGFEATGDPLTDPTASVTHVFIQDPLYPGGSSRWGRSPRPDTKLTLKQLGSDFVPWRPGRGSGMSGRFVIVLPYLESRPADGRSNLD